MKILVQLTGWPFTQMDRLCEMNRKTTERKPYLLLLALGFALLLPETSENLPPDLAVSAEASTGTAFRCPEDEVCVVAYAQRPSHMCYEPGPGVWHLCRLSGADLSVLFGNSDGDSDSTYFDRQEVDFGDLGTPPLYGIIVQFARCTYEVFEEQLGDLSSIPIRIDGTLDFAGTIDFNAETMEPIEMIINPIRVSILADQVYHISVVEMFTLVILHEYAHAKLRTIDEDRADAETDRIWRHVFGVPSPDSDEFDPSQHSVEAQITC